MPPCDGEHSKANSFQDLDLGMDGIIDDGLAYSTGNLQAAPPASCPHVASWDTVNTPPSQSDSTISIARDLVTCNGRFNSEATEGLLDTFYRCFHPAHPFIVPRKLYVENPDFLPEYLKCVMSFVASHYSRGTDQDALERGASVITSSHIPETGFKVQGLLLYAMATFARLDQAKATAILDQAVDVALKIGMNRRDYSYSPALQDPTLQESWRRTWWELFIVEGLSSSLSDFSRPFRLYSIPTDMPLPRSCQDYNKCHPPGHLRTLTEMQDRTFSNDDYPWSSFAYKIEAARILGTVLQLSPDRFAVTNPQVEAIDASISSFLLSLPPEKREVVEHDGVCDEVLFGAHMIIQWAAINVYRPRSSLTAIKNHYHTACTEKERSSLPAHAQKSYTSKALRAANALSSLTSIQSPLARHTPCFACAIALAATVQLPAYAIETNTDEARAIRERLQLAISALNAISEVWPLARVVRRQVAQFAREVFIKPVSTAETATASSFTTLPARAALNSAATPPFIDFDSMLNDDPWLNNLVQYEVGSNE